MSLPFRRRSRPRGAAGLTPVPDNPGIPDSSEADTEQWLSQIRTDPADGTTMPLRALRGQPRYAPPDPASHPYPAPPAAVLSLPQARAVMTVNPPRPGGPGPTPQALEVARFLRAKVIILKKRGHLDRISDDKLAMLPCDRIRNRRTTARLIVDDAAELLRCGGDPR